MKKLLIIIAFSASGFSSFCQLAITDKHIVNQQERMVFKQWDEDKFTPTPGFLYLNPEYWMTWALHPDYPKTDLRPLGRTGPQTMRLASMAQMSLSDHALKKHADTTFTTAEKKYALYSPLYASLDPLWLLYYRNELSPLLSSSPIDALFSLDAKSLQTLKTMNLLDHYNDQWSELSESLHRAMQADLERGNRILLYQSILQRYRKLLSSIPSQSSFHRVFSPTKRIGQGPALPSSDKWAQKDIEIADRILKASKL
ncbi:hypothetical protein ACJVDH_15185 [Pedobacter sp. AW1-32]|uniref:hypothetical protein n=1 Tax=Pedobacter sp. AW1-32 TaxID=3383026 RepID=UPI003FEDF20D